LEALGNLDQAFPHPVPVAGRHHPLPPADLTAEHVPGVARALARVLKAAADLGCDAGPDAAADPDPLRHARYLLRLSPRTKLAGLEEEIGRLVGTHRDYQAAVREGWLRLGDGLLCAPQLDTALPPAPPGEGHEPGPVGSMQRELRRALCVLLLLKSAAPDADRQSVVSRLWDAWARLFTPDTLGPRPKATTHDEAMRALELVQQRLNERRASGGSGTPGEGGGTPLLDEALLREIRQAASELGPRCGSNTIFRQVGGARAAVLRRIRHLEQTENLQIRKRAPRRPRA
jgi:hypothetical protein